MAHKKGQGASRNGRDSNPQYRGIKLYAGQTAKIGSIIVRQCGTKFKPGRHVGLGRDYTLYALKPGIVVFKKNHTVYIEPTVPPEPQAATS